MSPTGTRVQIAIGVGWLAVCLYWFFWSVTISSSRVTLLFCLVGSLMAGVNAFMVYRRSSQWESRPAWLSEPTWRARPKPAPEPTEVQAPEAPRIDHRVASLAQPPPRSSAPITQPIPIRPAVAASPFAQPPSPQQPPSRRAHSARASSAPVDSGSGGGPVPVWAASTQQAPTPPPREPQLRSELDPEPDPEQKWRRPRHGRS